MDKRKEEMAIQALKAFEPKTEPYYLCYSGGKDSDCIRILAELAGVKFDLMHNLTTVDAPETVQYVKSIPDVKVVRPELSMWELIVKHKTPPFRIARYCCAELKENGGKGRVKITGVRRAESVNRAANGGLVKVLGKQKTTMRHAEDFGADYTINPAGGVVLNMDNDAARRLVEHCYRTTATMVNPIIDWTDNDVWEFLHHYGCQSNPLYQCGFSRIGCIGCPMASPVMRKRELVRWPMYYHAYVRAFEKMLLARREAGLVIFDKWKDGEAVMRWWLGDDAAQVTLADIAPEWADMDFYSMVGG